MLLLYNEFHKAVVFNFENVLFILAERVFVFTISLIFNLALVGCVGGMETRVKAECSK